MALRCRVAFVKQSGNIVSPSSCLRVTKPNRSWDDDHTTEVRCIPDLIRWPYDGFAKAKMYTRIQHEIELLCVIDFGAARNGTAEGLNNIPTDIQWVKMHSRMARC